jgi:succinate dehydrogenase/fumarate reductase flavoprotein subunit
MQPDETFDVVIAGSGAAGLAAAVTAAEHGLKVLVLEKAAQFGGTTAWSGGWLWVPRNPLAVAAGIDEDKETIRSYLRAEMGNRYDAAEIEAFLEAAPEMVRFFHEETAVKFRDGNAVPDMHGDLPGAGTGGRSVTALPFDGRELGPELARLRPPKDEMSFLGMGIASGADLNHFLNMTRSVRSFLHVGRRFLKHLLDMVTHRRGLHLVNGNALAGRLARAAFDRGVDIRTSMPVRGLIRDGSRVAGVETDAGRVLARRGVVLAAGGFPNDPDRRRALVPHTPTGAEHWTAAPPENTGDRLRLGESVGGTVEAGLAHPAAWAPVSLVPKRDGAQGHFPHLIERAKPGVIAVRADGRRFTNEADGYHDFIADLLAATPEGDRAVCWLVCDHDFIRRYGLGYAKPAPLPLWPELRSGYLKKGATLADLARVCGIDPAGLEAAVARYNAGVAAGSDPEFGKGGTRYNRVQGDAARPDPCNAPIGRGPYYAVEVVPGSLGTFAGLRTDARARVLDGAGVPVPGLHAAGTDMASIMGGSYPAGGINLGPAMTFGFIAGRDLAGLPPLTTDS